MTYTGLSEKEFEDAAQRALAGDASGAVAAVVGVLAGAITGHPLAGVALTKGVSSFAGAVVDKATARFLEAGREHDEERERVRALALELRDVLAPFLLERIEELDERSSERFLQTLLFVEGRIATAESQAELRREMLRIRRELERLSMARRGIEPSLLHRKISQQCEDIVRPAGAFNFHPRDQFVPLMGQWHGSGAPVDLVESLAGKILAGERLRAIITADYGHGKSFLIWALALRLLRQRGELSVVPLVYPLRNHALASSEDPYEQLIMYWAHTLEVDARTLLDKCPCLIALDGLDELPTKTENLGVLRRLLGAIGDRARLSIVVTSRPGPVLDAIHDPSRHLPGFVVAAVAPWTPGSEQWRALLQRCEETHYASFAGGWRVFHEKVCGTALLDLTTRPLWCRMIIECRDSLPDAAVGSETGLYEHYVLSYLSGYRQRIKPDCLLGVPATLEVLELLAHGLLAGGVGQLEERDLLAIVQRFTGIPGSVVLRALGTELMNTSLLNVSKSSDQLVCGFGHKSFEEFFLARRALRLVEAYLASKSGIDALVDTLAVVEEQSAAREFLAGLLRDKSEIVDGLARLLSGRIEEAFPDRHELGVLRRALVRCWLDGSASLAAPRSMRGFQLQGLALDGVSLRTRDLRDANLTNTSLIAADLRGADLRGATCIGTNFTDARLSDAALDRAKLSGAIGLAR